MSWSSLPEDVVHVILAKVCLIELARMTTTCSSFRAAYCRRMAQEQEARCQLAVNTFGTERIACLLDGIVHFLKMEPFPPAFEGWKRFRICADGVLDCPVPLATPDLSEDGDIRGHLYATLVPNRRVIYVETHGGRGSMHVAFFPQHVEIGVNPINDEDIVSVALVQALLSEGLTQIIRDDGRRAEISIGRLCMETGFTQAGLKAQIAPLLPIASQYTPVETTMGEPVKERMLIKQV